MPASGPPVLIRGFACGPARRSPLSDPLRIDCRGRARRSVFLPPFLKKPRRVRNACPPPAPGRVAARPRPRGVGRGPAGWPVAVWPPHVRRFRLRRPPVRPCGALDAPPLPNSLRVGGPLWPFYGLSGVIFSCYPIFEPQKIFLRGAGGLQENMGRDRATPCPLVMIGR